MIARPWLACLLAAAVGGGARVAGACTCRGPTTYVSPLDGASDVPLNAVVFTARPDYRSWPLALVEVDTGAEVPTTPHGGRRQAGAQVVYEWETLQPASPLLPNTKYKIVFDDPSTGQTGTSFITGATMDSVAPPAVTPSAVGAKRTSQGACNVGNSCGGIGDGLNVAFTLAAPDVAWIFLELRRQGAADPFALIPVVGVTPGEPWSTQLGVYDCAPPAPDLVVGETYCARLVSFDVAGNAAPGADVCAQMTACALSATCDSCAAPVAPDAGLGSHGESAACAVAGRAGPTPTLLLLGLGLALACARRRRR